jgi:hypothetical protein
MTGYVIDDVTLIGHRGSLGGACRGRTPGSDRKPILTVDPGRYRGVSVEVMVL